MPDAISAQFSILEGLGVNGGDTVGVFSGACTFVRSQFRQHQKPNQPHMLSKDGIIVSKPLWMCPRVQVTHRSLFLRESVISFHFLVILGGGGAGACKFGILVEYSLLVWTCGFLVHIESKHRQNYSWKRMHEYMQKDPSYARHTICLFSRCYLYRRRLKISWKSSKIWQRRPSLWHLWKTQNLDKHDPAMSKEPIHVRTDLDKISTRCCKGRKFSVSQAPQVLRKSIFKDVVTEVMLYRLLNYGNVPC